MMLGAAELETEMNLKLIKCPTIDRWLEPVEVQVRKEEGRKRNVYVFGSQDRHIITAGNHSARWSDANDYHTQTHTHTHTHTK